MGRNNRDRSDIIAPFSSPIPLTHPFIKPHTRIATKGQQEAHEGYLIGTRSFIVVNGLGEVLEGPDRYDRYWVQMEKGGPKVWIGRRQFVVSG